MSTSVTDALLGSGFESILAALVAVSVGVISTILAARLNKTRALEIERLREFREALTAKRADESARVSGAIVNRPEGLFAADLQTAVSRAVKDSMAEIEAGTRVDYDFVADLITGYHKQALSQARVQFWFSVIAAAVGFVYILVVGFEAAHTNGTEYFKTIPGFVIEAVAALFFKQAEQTRERATALYDRLSQDKRAEAAARAVMDSIEDEKIRSLVKAQIALHMSGLNPRELNLQQESIE